MITSIIEAIKQYDPEDQEKCKLVSCFVKNTKEFCSKLKYKYITISGFKSAECRFDEAVQVACQAEDKETRSVAIKSIKKYLGISPV